MANFKTRAVSKEEFELIIKTISTGFVLPDGRRVKPNERVATILTLQANLGLRVGDVVKLRLSDIVLENGRYHLDITEQKTQKTRYFTVPAEVYIYIQNYAIKRGLKPKQRLFDISVRTVQNHLQLTCDYLGFGHSLGTGVVPCKCSRKIPKNLLN